MKTYVVKIGERTFESERWHLAWRQALRCISFSFDWSQVHTISEEEVERWNKVYNRLQCLREGEGFLATLPDGKQLSMIEEA